MTAEKETKRLAESALNQLLAAIAETNASTRLIRQLRLEPAKKD